MKRCRPGKPHQDMQSGRRQDDLWLTEGDQQQRHDQQIENFRHWKSPQDHYPTEN